MDLTRLMGAKVGLPVIVGDPTQQRGPPERKIALVVTEMEVSQLDHGIVRQGHGHPKVGIGKVDPLLGGEVVAADTGQLVEAGTHGLAAQVNASRGVGYIKGKN